MSETKPRLTQAQYRALEDWCHFHGRNWKGTLRKAWMTGKYDSGADIASLVQIRNAFGPTWLFKFRFKQAHSSDECAGERMAYGMTF